MTFDAPLAVELAGPELLSGNCLGHFDAPCMECPSSNAS
jgi:hypothetical protein